MTLLKDDKIQSEDVNNPLSDSMKARDLFFDEVTAFHHLDAKLIGVENGSASLLYISQESLRFRTIERLLLGRNVVP